MAYRLYTRLALMGLVVFCVSGEALAQTNRDVLNRLERMENEIQTLNRAVYRGETPPPVSSGGAMDAQNSAAIQVRLQGLEEQIRTLTGDIERQAYEVRQMRESFERFQTDTTMRLQTLEGGGAAAGGMIDNTGGATTTSQQGASMQGGGMQFIPPRQNDATQNPSPLTGAGGSDSNVEVNTETLGTLGGGNGTAAQAYEQAFALLRNGQYDQAQTAFDSFIENNPNDPLTANAQYWLGETYYVRGNYERAARIFAAAYQTYPQGQKAPDNMLKLGLSLAALGNTDDACVALAQLQKEFGGDDTPVTARGKQEMTTLGCPS